MKRLSILLIILMLMLSSVTYAANWQWILSTDEQGYFFDTQSVVYTGQTNSYAYGEGAQYWMKVVFTPSSAAEQANIYDDYKLSRASYKIQKERLDFTNKKITYLGNSVFYDETGRVIASYDSGEYTNDIIPGTVGEAIMEHIRDFCRRKKH